MKAAFATWNNRIAPVFDVARHLHVVEAEAGKVFAESDEVFDDDLPQRKAIFLSELDAHTLVCGAVSRPVQEVLAAYGIEVIPFIAGGLEEVVAAWLADELNAERFAMPGCCGRGNRARRGMRQSRDRAAQTTPATAAIPRGRAGDCVCPVCGHRVAHRRGIACNSTNCPDCGSRMCRAQENNLEEKRR